MKRHLHSDICLYCPVWSRQSTAEMIVALGLTAFVGFVRLLTPLNR